MIVLWTDGSAVPNPGPGGFAVLRETEGRFAVVNLGSEEQTTNIRMEGRALRCAMQYILREGGEAEIHTDSQFWVNVLTKWAPDWKANDWKRKRGSKPIENLDLVKDVYQLYEQAKPKLIFGYGHIGVVGNELAD